ncbi:hypothetical protein ES707_05162 [subsurface metagenome]
MSKIKILFDIEYVYHLAAMDPVIDVFAHDDRYNCAINYGIEPYRRFGFWKIPSMDMFLPHLKVDRLRRAEPGEKFDAVFVGDTKRNAEQFGKTMLCFVNHGTGIKTVIYRNLRRHSHTKYMIFVEGEYRYGALQESGALGLSQVHKIGLPKIDPYFREGTFDREEILLRYGLDPDKKTVLYAPTFKPTSIYRLENHIFTETRDYNLIIKLHHYSWMGKYAPHRQHRIFERRVGKYPHAALVPVQHYNILPLMAASDTLISEASSTIFDYLALGKFGVIYDLDHERLKHSDGEPIMALDNRRLFDGAFVHIDQPNKISKAVAQAVNPTTEMKAKGDEYRNFFFHQLDGNAAQRLKVKFEELLADEGNQNNPVAPQPLG